MGHNESQDWEGNVDFPNELPAWEGDMGHNERPYWEDDIQFPNELPAWEDNTMFPSKASDWEDTSDPRLLASGPQLSIDTGNGLHDSGGRHQDAAGLSSWELSLSADLTPDMVANASQHRCGPSLLSGTIACPQQGELSFYAEMRNQLQGSPGAPFSLNASRSANIFDGKASRFDTTNVGPQLNYSGLNSAANHSSEPHDSDGASSPMYSHGGQASLPASSPYYYTMSAVAQVSDTSPTMYSSDLPELDISGILEPNLMLASTPAAHAGTPMFLAPPLPDLLGQRRRRSRSVASSRGSMSTGPFTCRNEDCIKTFGKQADLHKHERYHDEHAKTFVCDNCGKPFLFRKDLLKHNVKHTQLRTFFCLPPGCGKGFLRKDHLLRHRRTEHPDLAPLSATVPSAADWPLPQLQRT